MNEGVLRTGGVALGVTSHVRWLWDMVAESTAGALHEGDPAEAELQLTISAERTAFVTEGWQRLSRDAWSRSGQVVIEDVCTTGLDLRLAPHAEGVEMEARWRPRPSRRVLQHVLSSRFHLLVRAALVQYPVLWWAASRGCAPLHVSAFTVGGSPAVFAGGSGVGKSTLLREAVAGGEVAATDNVAVSDGHTVWGLVEPVRAEGGRGRKMPHGRREAPLQRRVESLVPECVVVLRRSTDGAVRTRRLRPEEATRWLVGGTYLAGELRRFWPFAAVLSLGTALGPAHPPVERAARALTGEAPCVQLTLPQVDGIDITELIKAGVH